MNVWAAIMLWDGANPRADRVVKENAQERLTIVFVSSVDQAAEVAVELVHEGVELIELCGGFGLDAGAIVSSAVAGRCAIGVVSFGIESITQAARYKAKFESPDPTPSRAQETLP